MQGYNYIGMGGEVVISSIIRGIGYIGSILWIYIMICPSSSFYQSENKI